MNTLNIKRQQLEYLANNIKNCKLKIKIESSLINEKKDKINSPSISLTQTERKMLLDELTDLLMLNGFNPQDEINEEGQLIEEIIDILNPY